LHHCINARQFLGGSADKFVAVCWPASEQLVNVQTTSSQGGEPQMCSSIARQVAYNLEYNGAKYYYMNEILENVGIKLLLDIAN
jgi:hypothetical protein